MAKRRSRVADYLVYLLVQGVVAILQALTVEMGQQLAKGLAWLAYHIDRRHRLVAMDNLRQALPELTNETALKRYVLRVYEHFALMIIEMVHLPRKLHPHNWRNLLELAQSEALVQALLNQHAKLIVTGHYGNWEMAGYALAMFGFRSFAIARPLDNPYLDRLVRRFRQKTGQQLLAKKGELDRIEMILEGGGIVCTLGDQDAGQNGLFVNFFGRPASTHKAIALLAIRHQATLIVAAARRLNRCLHYRLEVTDIIDPSEYADNPKAVQLITQRFTEAFERLIRLDPTQYLWLHRRWKHQPKPKVRKAA